MSVSLGRKSGVALTSFVREDVDFPRRSKVVMGRDAPKEHEEERKAREGKNSKERNTNENSPLHELESRRGELEKGLSDCPKFRSVEP